MPSRQILLGNAIVQLKEMTDNLYNDFGALKKVDEAISGARAELADQVRVAIEGARVDHTRKQLDHIQDTVREAMRLLTELGAYDDSEPVIEAEEPEA